MSQGRAKELLFLAPCTVEEARRDAGLMPLKSAPNSNLDLAPKIWTCPAVFEKSAEFPMTRAQWEGLGPQRPRSQPASAPSIAFVSFDPLRVGPPAFRSSVSCCPLREF